MVHAIGDLLEMQESVVIIQRESAIPVVIGA